MHKKLKEWAVPLGVGVFLLAVVLAVLPSPLSKRTTYTVIQRASFEEGERTWERCTFVRYSGSRISFLSSSGKEITINGPYTCMEEP